MKHIGASRLRQLTAKSLAELSGAIVVQGTDAEPLAVIVPFATWQRALTEERIRNLSSQPVELLPAREGQSITISFNPEALDIELEYQPCES